MSTVSAPAYRALPLVLGLLAAGVTYGASSPRAESHMRGAVKATLLGEPVAIDAQIYGKLRHTLRAHLAGKITLTLSGSGGGVKKTMSREALGVRIDEVRLAALGRALTDAESPLLSNAARAPKTPLSLPVPIVLDAKAALAALSSMKDDVDEPPQDAKIDLDARKVVAEIPGRRVKVYETIAAIEQALAKGATEVEVAFDAIAPKVDAAALAHVDLGDVIGFFETRYATDAKHADRTFNLRLAASRLNGKVILPGETFDFNAVVGPRDEAHGYRIAKVIADGELIDGIGGGTCQIAGTLHGAAFFSGLEIVSRTPHTRPSSYIKMGLDAAVAYPHVTLRLRNPFPHPVVLRETVTGGVVRAEVLGPKRARLVTFIRKIDDVIPFSERVVMDDRLPKGTKIITQRGIPGFKVRRYRVVREGPNAVREKTSDSYPPTQQIVHIGTGADPSAPSHMPSHDDHPEYVADEYLAITQGPGVGKPASANELSAASGMEEVRVAGKTGTKGWSRKYTTGPISVPGAAPGSSDPDADDEPAPGGGDGNDTGDANGPSPKPQKKSPSKSKKVAHHKLP